MQQEKNLSKKESSALSTEFNEDWGANEQFSPKDLVIPRILAMQGMSEFVTEGKAKFGDMIESMGEKVLGSFEKSFEITPFKMEKWWRIETPDGKELKRMIPVVSDPTSEEYNENMPYEGVDPEFGECRRVLAYNFYVLLAGEAMPYMVQFKSTSAKAGKKLATQMFVKNRMANKSPAGTTFSLSVSKQQNDHGTFSVFDVSISRDTTKEEEAEALKWFKMFKTTTVKVHEEGSEIPF